MKKTHLLILGLILFLGFILRIWNLGNIPPSLYWDEMDVGFQSYSLLKTQNDYFGNSNFLTVHSFADYRAPLLIYLTIPFTAIFGLNEFSVRLPSAILGTFSIFLIYLLSKILFKSEKISLISALFVSLAPWSIQYSRIAYEQNLLLVLFLSGIISFLKGVKSSKYFILSGTAFGLTLFTYNTAKLFSPIILITLAGIFALKIKKDKNFWIGFGVFALLFFLSLYSSFFQGGGTRFNEIAVWTDPQIEQVINLKRETSAKSYTEMRDTGMNPRFLDKIFYNKATFTLEKITQNYLNSYSPEFLFLKGDPNLRHSTGKTGMLLAIEFFTIILGLVLLFQKIKKGDKNSLFLVLWIILAPLSAIITREGGMHASRLFLMFPALTITSAVGAVYILGLTRLKFGKVLVSGICLLWLFSVLFYLNHYFGAYNLENAKYFQFGFPEAVRKAQESKNAYDYVIIDDRGDSGLMNYLFYSKYDPTDFQSRANNLTHDFGTLNSSKFKADKLENVYFMNPSRRDWKEAFEENLIDGNYLLIVSSLQLEEQTPEKVQDKLTPNQKLLETYFYKTGEPAFYVIESKKPTEL